MSYSSKTPIVLRPEDYVWAGSEESWQQALLAIAEANAAIKAGGFGADREDRPLFERMGNVAMVQVRGPILNMDSPILEMFGMATYPGIRRAIVAAAQDPSVETILQYVDSPGGSVNGCGDTSQLIRKINAQVKPVVTFAGGTMASAAYWLGASAGEVLATETSVVGSIGVLATVFSRSRQLVADGIDAKVVRSGKFKALLNPIEPLSPEAIAQLQALIDHAGKIFTQHVADLRGVSFATVENKMGQGREFMGQMALIAGLIDAVTSFDELASKLQAQKSVDNRKRLYDNSITQAKGGNMTMQASTLTDQEIAALAAGAGSPAPAPVSDLPKAAADAAALQATAAAKKIEDDAAAAAKAVADKAVVDIAVAANSGQLAAYLQTQVKEKDAALLAAQVNLNGLQEKLNAIDATHAGLLAVAKTSLSNMQVALGGTKDDCTGMSDVQVLASHAELTTKFQAKYKVGGVAAVSAAENKPDNASPGALQEVRLSLVRPLAK